MGNNVTTLQREAVVGEAALYSATNLSLIKRTVAKDCNEDEFNIFIAMCRATKLDPLRRQCYAFVFKKKNNRGEVTERNLTLVTAIGGFRTIADRTGNYRPDEDEPEIVFDEREKSETNPHGIVKAVGRVWKFSHGEWHRTTVAAYWDEFAPIKDEWEKYTNDRGEEKNRKTGKKTLDTSGQWGKMGRWMISKCAEAGALRKAFPDEFANVHEDAEIDRAKIIDLLPSEAVEVGETEDRLKRIGGSGNLVVDWLKGDMAPLDMVPIGQFFDRSAAFIREHSDEPSQIILWRERNRHALQEFWARAKSDALELKKLVEKSLEAGE